LLSIFLIPIKIFSSLIILKIFFEKLKNKNIETNITKIFFENSFEFKKFNKITNDIVINI